MKLEIFDLLGRKVATLLDEVREPGRHTVDFDGSNLSSGVYMYRLNFANKTFTKKMLLLK